MSPTTSPTAGERTGLERSLQGPHLSFHLGVEADRLRRERPWVEHGHNAITLAKHADLRLVLEVLRAGARIATREPQERMSMEVLAGRIRLHVGGRTMDLAQGHLLVLDRGTAHEIEAVEDSAFLLTVGQPGG
ncbi:MAG: hypothetical protein HZB56_20375 [Deltaproteobacteria bacterium]|nr:hypothetical protein [Deltaproteobacteria bacterium]